MKRGISLLLAVLLAVLCACWSGEEERLEAANTFLTAMLTVPNETYNAAVDAFDEDAMRAAVEELEGGLTAEGMTDAMLRGDHSMRLMMLGAMRQIAVRPTAITLDQNQGDPNLYVYDAAVLVSVNGGAEVESTVSGRIQFNDEGLIRYLDMDGPLFDLLLDAEQREWNA